MKADVVRYCRTCHTCQLTSKPNQVVPRAPLFPIPAIGEPFERVIVDCVGPLPRAKSGNEYLLTIMCVATRFPEAVPVLKITTAAVLKALTKFFCTCRVAPGSADRSRYQLYVQSIKQVLQSLSVKRGF